ncbi:MAG: Ni/Fe hydrogenase subunit alpha [Nitrospirae bacterium]|nr:Ni/Fe hydrogenase subunit alpha [Nitrospirota bacterium]
MGENIKINIQHLTRVEGHGNIVVDLKDGTLKTCNLEIVEAPRFFEGMLRGRSIFEAQHITSRICGICACGHTLASIQAAEDALGITPSPQTIKLRKLLLHMEILDSHILHIYLLAVPDLLGVKSFMPLIDTHNAVVRRALRLKKACNDVCNILVGRHVHPIRATIGGFTKLPTDYDLDLMLKQLTDLHEDLDETIELISTLEFPQFQRESEFVALVSDNGEYPLLSGNIGSTNGVRMNKSDYKKITNEYIVPHSSAKFTRLSQDSYAVGALARLNLNCGKLNPKAKETAEKLNLANGSNNPFLNTVAQAVECVHCLNDGIKIIEELKATGIDYKEEILVGANETSTITVKSGKGVGAVEVPRGVLFHAYETDETGRILNADIIVPTGQNLANIEADMRALIPTIRHKSEEEITLALEMLVRAYDPCISCSAHFLDVKFVNRRR